MGLLKPIVQLATDSPLRVLQFRHTGPSRCGEPDICVVVCPDDNEPVVTVVYYHHEGVNSAPLAEFLETNELMVQNESDPEWKQDLLDIAKIVQEIVANEAKDYDDPTKVEYTKVDKLFD